MACVSSSHRSLRKLKKNSIKYLKNFSEADVERLNLLKVMIFLKLELLLFHSR
ncbi:MAG TPA: hypothetical protein DFI63_01550, partial [Lachnospiraceae bacterium]|nr:hypothetical protein [Lachnospiraceae bacterium]